ncbi:MAG TPA: RNA 2'-phosphotransferase, partial [Kofleriaceae bacterium]
MANRVSKFLSLVLRHDPARIGIFLDDAGWTDVGALLAAATAHGVPLTRDELVAIVAESDKQRFALSPDGTRIRANQGHSVEVDLQLAAAEPPAMLYHGTVEAALPGIRERGLVRGARHHVHLSADVTTATKVGARRGKPTILTIRADAMVAAGITFYRSENGVWLVDHVPAQFIIFKGPKGSGTVTRGAKVGIAKDTLAACDAGAYTNAAGERVELRAAIDAAKRGTVGHELGVG